MKVSTNVKIAMQCFENFGGGGNSANSPPLVAPLAESINYNTFVCAFISSVTTPPVAKLWPGFTQELGSGNLLFLLCIPCIQYWSKLLLRSNHLLHTLGMLACWHSCHRQGRSTLTSLATGECSSDTFSSTRSSSRTRKSPLEARKLSTKNPLANQDSRPTYTLCNIFQQSALGAVQTYSWRGGLHPISMTTLFRASYDERYLPATVELHSVSVTTKNHENEVVRSD